MSKQLTAAWVRRVVAGARFTLWVTALVALAQPTHVSPQQRGLILEPLGPASRPFAAERLYDGSEALIIGATDYRGWSPLAWPARDAYRVRDVLEEQGFRVTVRTDGNGLPVRHPEEYVPSLTGERIAREMKSFLVDRRHTAGTRLVIWFGGHGAPSSGEGFLLGTDAPPIDDPAFPLRALHIRDVANWVRLSQARHVLIVFDACFAATIFEPRRQVRAAIPLQEMVRAPVRQFISAGGPGELVPDESVFCSRFLRALRGEDPLANPNGDAYLTGSELGLYLAITVSYDRVGKQAPQYGELLDERFDKGNIVFRWRGAPEQSLPPISVPPEESGSGTEPQTREQWVPVSFRDCAGCPEMVTLPAGVFGMGDERLRTEVADEFSIGVYETTFDEWDLCRAEGVCTPAEDRGWGRGRRPVIGVSLEDVFAFLDWLGKKSNYRYRLPTEAEWEYAARAGTSTEYWFGDGMQPGRANCRGCGPSAAGRTLEVGSFAIMDPGSCDPARPGDENCFGVHDVHGNVWEWVCQSAEGRPCTQLEDTAAAAVRGGSWANGPVQARAASRAEVPAELRSAGVGFRVVREPGHVVSRD